jgi:hypothetical protein
MISTRRILIKNKLVTHDGITIASGEEGVTISIPLAGVETSFTEAEFLKIYDMITHLIEWND